MTYDDKSKSKSKSKPKPKLKIVILTLFPEMFAPMQESIMRRAQQGGHIELETVNIRDYAEDPHFADDGVYGGGAGMVLKPEPVINALEAKGYTPGSKVIVTTPGGKSFRQADAQRLSQCGEIYIIAGHYEGIDQRVTELTHAEEFSIGDYVLTGGELPAMVMADAMARLVPGVLGDSASLEEESFSAGLLEHPQYTRPAEFRGIGVPEALLTGDHKVIEAWRRRESVIRTCRNRPDLLKKVPLNPEEKLLAEQELKGEREDIDIYMALVHYPVYDPKNHIIGTSVTNLDIHDIARLGRTYNVKGYFIVQPGEEQKDLTSRLLGYWTEGHGSKVNPDRKEALDRVKMADSLEDAVEAIKAIESKAPLTVGTSAKIRPGIVGYDELRLEMAREKQPFLLVFGTGYGLTEETMAGLDYVVRPIEGRGEYNHLSVRSAVSITLDRLIGER